MKKISVVLIIGIIYSSVISNVNAQIFRGKNNARSNGINGANTGYNYESSEKMPKAGFKSLKAFNRDFKNDRDVKWFFEPNVISATFTRDDIKTNVVYDKKGHWLRTVKTYQENKMDRGTREVVKSKYFDDKITQVQEINEGQLKCYLVYLENESSFKTVSVVDGDMHIYEQFKKQSKS